MKSYILLFALTLYAQIEANPQKNSAQIFVHAAFAGKIDRNCPDERLKSKKIDQERKKARDAKYAWLICQLSSAEPMDV